MGTPATARQPDAQKAWTPGTAPRLGSLDAFRGWAMFWIVGGNAIMLGLQHLSHNTITDAIVYQLDHTPWQGLRYYDLIWPSFMLMTGMSVPFSYAKRSLTQSYGEMLWHVLRRVLILFLLGSIRESVSLNRPYFVELSSALQPIAIAYLIAFLLVRRPWRFEASVGGYILIGYALLLAFVPGPGVAAGSYDRASNLVAAVDVAILGRTHPEGWGTVLSIIPTIATTILGSLLGKLLMSQCSVRKKIVVIAGVGVSGVLLGLALNPVVPIIMKLWTTSYGLASAGWACLLFLVFYFAIDVAGYRKWAFPFIVIGLNALTVYLAGSLIPLNRIVGIYTAGLAAQLGALGPLFQAAVVLVCEWLILYWMYRRRIFLTA